MTRRRQLLGMCIVVGMFASPGFATPDFVEHFPDSQVYGEDPGVMMRDPAAPSSGTATGIWVRVGYSFYYTDVAIYFTTDGSTPTGSKGVPSGTTSVVTSDSGELFFVRNEPASPSNIDWWRTILPGLPGGTEVRYVIGAWHDDGGPEVFANNYNCADDECDDPAITPSEFTYTVADAGVPWPGAGAGSSNPDIGYPPVSFWKEEGVVGNNYMNVMIDQNGTVYDIYYPSAGCVQGMGTKNEGYVDGLDTFPPGLPPDHRGQMNINQAMAGIRVNGLTYWLSNENGVGYSNVSQQYVTNTNVIETAATLTAANIHVQQYDFCPKGVTFPQDLGGQPNRGIYIKRFILTNNGDFPEKVQFYYFADYALNGGDSYDTVYADAGRGAMVAYDNTQRNTSSSGEYNPTTFGDYNKDVSIYLATSMKLVNSVGSSGGTPASSFWSDTSGDTELGWVGMNVELLPGEPKEVDVAFIGGFDNFGGATGTYAFQMEGAIDWFLSENAAALQDATETYWRNWLAEGVTVDTPEEEYDDLIRRGLLATALHLDGANGGIIAGMHNGAYPFVWPRDAAWAAITLARSGHVNESERIYEFLRDVAYRDVEGWGRKGFWKQKYSTDGYTIWGTPQVDETSCYPWGIRFIYDTTGDLDFLANHYDEVYEAAIASSQDSTIDSRLRYEEAVDLIYSMNLWEDSFDTFVYSNASVIRGLEDAAEIATILDEQVCPGGPGTCNYHNDAALFTARANALRAGLDARLAWNGENCDISQIGISYPFDIYPPDHARVATVLDRINGIASDTFGNFQPLMNFDIHGEWEGLVNRYWGDSYWHNNAGPNPNASPWFLTTMWYGAHYAQRQDLNPGRGDIDNHKYRLDLLIDRLGPIGFGAEQIAPSNSLLYPGQTDFLLETAWPNAWESMSFFVDSVMLFLDYTPDAGANTLRIEPKLPTAWSGMAFENLRLGDHRVDVDIAESLTTTEHTFTNRTGGAFDFETVARIPAEDSVFAVLRNGADIAYTHDAPTGRVTAASAIEPGADAVTQVVVYFGTPGDADADGDIDLDDAVIFIDCLSGPGNTAAATCRVFDFDADHDVDLADFGAFQGAFGG